MSELSKMAEKLDLHGLVKNVKSALNPEMAVPADEKENPVNYRIVRLTKLMGDMAVMRKAMDRDFDRLETNLRELLVELNPEVFKQAEMDDKEKPKAEAEDKAEDAVDPKLELEAEPKAEADANADKEGDKKDK